jgi:hypothetical protein
MNLLPALAFALLSLANSAFGQTATRTPTVATSNATVVKASFGTFKQSASGSFEFKEAAVVPLTPGQQYGWVIQLGDSPPKLRWLEELTLPSAPESWGPNEAIGTRTITDGARVSNTEREVEPVNDVIFNIWSVAPGDPSGHYKIRVFISGVKILDFEFEVR